MIENKKGNKIDSTLVLFSGGQDSTTVLIEAKRKFSKVECIIFDYGQKHIIEIEQAKKIAYSLGAKYRVVSVKSILELTSNALNSDVELEIGINGIPNTFVRNRNLLFLTVADLYAKEIGIESLTIGVSSVDYSGYLDCRDEFIRSAERTLTLSSGKTVIYTPLIFKNKADTFKLAEDLGFIDFIVERTHTCYRGDRSNKHYWGYGCGECPACRLRKKGFDNYIKIYGTKSDNREG